MDVSSLIVVGLGLVAFLGFLIFLLLYTSRKRKAKLQESATQVHGDVMDFDSLKALITNKHTTAQVLKESLDMILKHYGHIPSKTGLKAHPEFQKYTDIIVSICLHPHTSKNLILNFDKELSRLNPEYKSDINDAVTKGVKAREV